MSNTAELCARLLEHAAIHDRETSPYSPEQAAWAADLRDAAALIQAAPVVERADSATPVVERGARNLSDNAAPVAHAEPASEPAPAPRLRWAEAPRRTEWGAGMMEALIALGVDETLRLYAHRDAVPMVDALLSAQPAPARVPLYDQAALDAALNLWPRDCRLCANFTTRTGGCVSVVQCVDSMQFKATPPRQYWVSAPNAELTGTRRP